jgi:elongation factor G
VLRSRRSFSFQSLGPQFINAEARLKKAQEDAASMNEEVAAARMTPDESKRLARVRNIGIAVCVLGHSKAL